MTGATQLLAEKDFGGLLDESDEVSTVGTSQTTVVKNDPERVFLMFVNLSVNTIYLNISDQVSASNGIKLTANGGTLILNATEDYSLVTRALYAEASAAGSNLLTIQMRRDVALNNQET